MRVSCSVSCFWVGGGGQKHAQNTESYGQLRRSHAAVGTVQTPPIGTTATRRPIFVCLDKNGPPTAQTGADIHTAACRLRELAEVTTTMVQFGPSWPRSIGAVLGVLHTCCCDCRRNDQYNILPFLAFIDAGLGASGGGRRSDEGIRREPTAKEAHRHGKARRHSGSLLRMPARLLRPPDKISCPSFPFPVRPIQPESWTEARWPLTLLSPCAWGKTRRHRRASTS